VVLVQLVTQHHLSTLVSYRLGKVLLVRQDKMILTLSLQLASNQALQQELQLALVVVLSSVKLIYPLVTNHGVRLF